MSAVQSQAIDTAIPVLRKATEPHYGKSHCFGYRTAEKLSTFRGTRCLLQVDHKNASMFYSENGIVVP
jgi:hypothetical protein